MNRHLLKYVPWAGLEKQELDEGHLYTYSASKNFCSRGLDTGDTIWLVSALTGSPSNWRGGELYLCGRLVVKTLSQSAKDVAQAVGMRWRDVYGAGDSIWYAIGRPDAVEPHCRISIEDIAADLRFEGGVDRLSKETGIGQQLQTLRWLTEDSAQLLEQRRLAYKQSEDIDDDAGPGDVSRFEGAAFTEGNSVNRLHHVRERSRSLVDHAKSVFRRHHNGRLFCEICGFDFTEVYGTLGDGFIEAHHRVPLSQLAVSGAVTTRIADLAMVCANCHRMIHRRTPWPTIEDLRAIVRRGAA